ncbi:hypothetical protein RI049_08645 [Cedecea neteri]|uniref:hypothetical protein n=1 Tax=Cedecea neteri TaxID=158822 RepID=UPI002AA70109|nr:hypothetical protein [Cedecea neteri]WPU24790.1 hypothetical protein RI049_08645 [Cedecea neteri]
MINKKIYYWWSPNNSGYYPSGREPNEDMRFKPKQGYGVCEIASWLSADLPTSVKSVDMWLNNLTNLESSRAPDGFFGIGNAHWVMITNNLVFIACEYVKEQRVILEREQLIYILEQYKEFVQGDFNNPNVPPESIDVEYIAEGEEAMNIYASLEGSHGVYYLEE